MLLVQLSWWVCKPQAPSLRRRGLWLAVAQSCRVSLVAFTLEKCTSARRSNAAPSCMAPYCGLGGRTIAGRETLDCIR